MSSKRFINIDSNLTALFTCCDFSIQTMVGSSLHPVVCMRPHVLLTLFVSACRQCCPTHNVFVFCLFLSGFYSFSCVTCVANFYGLCILCYPFSILYRLLTLEHYMLSKCPLVCIISQLWIKVSSIVILM
jgi:hypothetical protein